MNTIKQHQEMGYDRSVGMFSPDGLLLQVEYAEKAVKLGSSVLALTTSEGLVFIGDRKITSKLLIKDSFKKIFEVDSHILIAGAGVMSDGRRLIEQAQSIAQDNHARFQSAVDTISLVKDVANIQQYYSQAGGLRPFGVSLLIGSIENGKPLLYQTTPSGIYMRFLARCVGNVSDKINEELEEKYKESLTNKEAIKIGLKMYEKVLEKEYNLDRFDVVVLDLKENMKRFSTDELKKL